MNLFRYMETNEFEQVIFCNEPSSRLKGIIAIHDTTLGPALGGTRMWNYASEEDALEDVLRLAQGMTYKNAAAGLDLGGGKAVIIGDPKTDKNPEMFRAFGRYIQALNGRYITAEDVGTTVEDMDLIHLETPYVTGTSPVDPSASGNPAPITAYGIYKGMKAAAKEAFGTDSLVGKTIAVQGAGNVSYSLCEYLYEEGANLIVTDINQEAVNRVVEQFNAQAVGPNDIYQVECDIFAPCALGAIINDETIPLIKAKVIAGSANNQLKKDEHGDMLHELGIIYAPDYVINAGGVINVADELGGYNRDRALRKVNVIYNNLERVFEISNRDNIPTYLAADYMVEERMSRAHYARKQFLLNEQHILNRK